jgi:type IV secretion system protein VirD4
LLEVRRGEWEVRDVQNVADVLVDPEGSLERRNHWEKTSHSLLVGAILHVLYAEPDKTLAGVAAFLSDPSRTIEQTLRAMMATPHLGEAGRASRRRQRGTRAAEQIRQRALRACSARPCRSSASTAIRSWRSVTRACHWRISDLVEGERPAALSGRAAQRHQPHQAAHPPHPQPDRAPADRGADPGKRHRVLLMLDEFPALGRLDFFESALAFMAGYGLKAFLIAQSLNQIEKAYGQNNAILDNCHVRVSFATNDERTAKRVIDALGTATECAP